MHRYTGIRTNEQEQVIATYYTESGTLLFHLIRCTYLGQTRLVQRCAWMHHKTYDGNKAKCPICKNQKFPPLSECGINIDNRITKSTSNFVACLREFFVTLGEWFWHVISK